MGKEAARERYYHVSGSFSLTREEVGNSGSPVNGDIDPTPLPTPSDDSESSAGDLMTSNIEPIPQGGLDLESSASRSEEHTSELQSLMRISYAVFCLKKKKNTN